MTDRPPVVFFGEDWARHPSTGQHMARELAKETTILWVNSLGLRTPRLNAADIKRIGRKLVEYFRSARSVQTGAIDVPTNMHVAAPLAIPLQRFKFVRRLNCVIVARHLRRKLASLRLRDPIVLASSLAAVDVVDRLGTGLRMYYCADDYASLPGANEGLVRALEHEMIGKVDVVIVTSATLWEDKRELHRHVVYLPHGVDHERFASALEPRSAIPAPLAELPRPRVGFVGILSEHIDFALLQHVADELRDVSIVMVGPVEAGTVVPRRKNLAYVGAVPHRAVPDYLANFDVCIVPYLTEARRIKYANPTKIREYLAAGRPVVSTPQPEARKLAPYVTFAETKEAFVNAIRQKLAETDQRVRQTLSDSMKTHSWRLRVTAFWRTVEEATKRRGTAGREATNLGGGA